MDYKGMLTYSYAMEVEQNECAPTSRLDFLGDSIFNFTTYDSEMSALFAHRALEVCQAIQEKTTFEYIKDPENYGWYLLMCNMPFFKDRLTWGTSIRGAWWECKQPEIHSCGLWDDCEQILDLKFDQEDWPRFIDALIEFAAETDDLKQEAE